jgi:hypothetical protein
VRNGNTLVKAGIANLFSFPNVRQELTFASELARRVQQFDELFERFIFGLSLQIQANGFRLNKV